MRKWTKESAIDYLTEIGWLPEHDRILTEKPHGEWVYKKFDEKTGISDSYFCSHCGFPLTGIYNIYCAVCGFDMRKEGEVQYGSDNRSIEKKNCDNCFLSIGEQCDIIAPSENCRHWKPFPQ